MALATVTLGTIPLTLVSEVVSGAPDADTLNGAAGGPACCPPRWNYDRDCVLPPRNIRAGFTLSIVERAEAAGASPALLQHHSEQPGRMPLETIDSRRLNCRWKAHLAAK